MVQIAMQWFAKGFVWPALQQGRWGGVACALRCGLLARPQKTLQSAGRDYPHTISDPRSQSNAALNLVQGC